MHEIGFHRIKLIVVLLPLALSLWALVALFFFLEKPGIPVRGASVRCGCPEKRDRGASVRFDIKTHHV